MTLGRSSITWSTPIVRPRRAPAAVADSDSREGSSGITVSPRLGRSSAVPAPVGACPYTPQRAGSSPLSPSQSGTGGRAAGSGAPGVLQGALPHRARPSRVSFQGQRGSGGRRRGRGWLSPAAPTWPVRSGFRRPGLGGGGPGWRVIGFPELDVCMRVGVREGAKGDQAGLFV